MSMSTTPNPNRAARYMAKRRWSNKTPAQRLAHAKMMAKARWAGKTDAERLAHSALMSSAKRKKTKT